MGQTEELFDRLHQLIEQHENRGVIPALDAAGQLTRPLQQAAASILSDRGGRVVIITGFFVPEGDEPRPETDGPIGAAQLANFLDMGEWDVELITDKFCGMASMRCRELVGGKYPIKVLSEAALIEKLHASWSSSAEAPKHLIAIERAGPNSSGTITNFAGDNISEVTPPLHRLFQWEGEYQPTTISLADGLNEIGAGNIRKAIASVSQDFDHGQVCTIEVDHLVLGCTANCCATALAAALAIKEPEFVSNLANCFGVDITDLMLERLSAEKIAVDGVLRRFSNKTVDGIATKPLSDTTRALIRTAATRSVLRSVE